MSPTLNGQVNALNMKADFLPLTVSSFFDFHTLPSPFISSFSLACSSLTKQVFSMFLTVLGATRIQVSFHRLGSLIGTAVINNSTAASAHELRLRSLNCQLFCEDGW
jgi:hypothetical protein